MGVLAYDKVTVSVKQGKLLGQRKRTLPGGVHYFAFYAIPYAHPPIGKLRFKNPKAVTKWVGTYNSTLEYYGACAQSHIVHKSRQYGTEDCLYVNIYTPLIPKDDYSNLKPVIVFIHGYAFASCFSHIYGPDFFINNDVMLVTLTHRIGVFGFLKSDEEGSDTNMGLKDIVLALKWIKTNIKQFGGDRKKITLMGSSSAATFISLLMTTDANKLFSKVILQSGAIFSPSIFQGDPKSETTRLIQELKRRHLTLTTAPTLEVLAAAHNIFIRNNKEMEDLQRPIIPFTPIIEQDLNSSLLVWTPDEFYSTIKKKNIYLDKPILIGFNTQESISEVMPFIHNPYYLKLFIRNFKFMVPFSDGCSYNTTSRTYKIVSAAIKDKYFIQSSTGNSLTSLLKYASDLLKFPVLKFVKTHLNFMRNKMYMYKFDYRGRLNAVKATSIAEKTISISGVASGDELCYLFRCEPLWESYALMNSEGFDRDKEFIEEVSLLWSNFAKYGDPTPIENQYTNLTWLPVQSKMNNVLLIRKYFKLTSLTEENAMYKFWNHLYETYYKKEVCHHKHDEL